MRPWQGWRWVMDTFPGSGPSLWLTLHSGCPILTREPCRTPWVWAPLPTGPWVSEEAGPGAEIQLCGRSSSAGRGAKASAHFAAWLPTHRRWKLGMLQFFFDWALLASSGEITSKSNREEKELLSFCTRYQEPGFVALNAKKNHSLGNNKHLRKGISFMLEVCFGPRGIAPPWISLFISWGGGSCSIIKLSKGQVRNDTRIVKVTTYHAAQLLGWCFLQHLSLKSLRSPYLRSADINLRYDVWMPIDKLNYFSLGDCSRTSDI